jgi:hypothetical protein
VSKRRYPKTAAPKRKRRFPTRSLTVGGRRRTLTPKQAEMLFLVRKGVTDFILEKATMVGFFDGLREISAGRHLFSHQLTKAVFSDIVGKATKKRLARSSGRVQRRG